MVEAKKPTKAQVFEHKIVLARFVDFGVVWHVMTNEKIQEANACVRIVVKEINGVG